MTVHIICAVFNGARFLPEFFQSIDQQTHADWRLWVRDDGSRDDTADLVREHASRDSRVRLLAAGGPTLGAARGFDWLLHRVPADAEYVMCADQDDVWLPHKIEITLAAMCAAELASEPGTRRPVLVHTDLSVVDDGLRMIHPSYWTFAGVAPEPVSMRRLIVRNVVTGATLMMNRPLRDLIGSAPAEAVLHDWWYALVAVEFGRVIAVERPTVLYRQHAANMVGARNWKVRLRDVPHTIVGGLRATSKFRKGIQQTAAQARAFLERYADHMTDEDRRFLEAYSRIPERSFLRRKAELFRLRALSEHGFLRTLGILVRG